MNCTRWHRLIALEVGGDLDPRRARGLYEHLESCAACRKLGEELRSQSQELMQLDREALDEVTLDSVRHAVLADIANRRRPIFEAFSGGQRLAIAGAAALILMVATVNLRQGEAPSQPRAVERVATMASAPATAPVPSPTTEPIVEPPEVMSPAAPTGQGDREPLRLARGDRPTPEPQIARSPSAPSEPMTVKILTDDPDVVIYWIVDPKGEKENA